MKEGIQDLGSNASRVFSGESTSQATLELYGETASLFAREIRERLPVREESYMLADIGSHKGELLKELLRLLPEYKFNVIAVDRDKKVLEDNIVTENIVEAEGERLPFDDGSIDVIIVRYLLQWNDSDTQREILKELSRVTKGFALLEHGGADNENTDDWRERMDNLLDDDEIPELKRECYYFSSRDEIERWMEEMGIIFERIRDRKVKNGSDVFVERYGLGQWKKQRAMNILGDRDYFIHTDWVIYPKTTSNS